MTDPVSAELFRRAQERFPGGVNSPVRAFRAVGGTPVFVDRAEGAYVWGADGTRYVDYIGSWGPMILGHAHPAVVAAVQQAMTRGASYGAPTAQETELADLVAELVPSIEMMRFTSSGTEAVMGALRVARGFTGRDLVVKFEGCYHGGADYLLVKAGSGLATFGVPTSAGVPASIASTCAVLPYNDTAALEQLFAERGAEIAAVILEPVVGNMGTVPPSRAFLDALRAVTTKHGALLVFDEVMTGFRLAKGGAQERFGMRPDLTTLGKIAGGGLPLGVYGGRREIMEKVAPLGPVYQAGTLSGNPLAVAAGLATLRLLQSEPGFYDRLERASAELEAILLEAAKASKSPVRIQRTGSMLTPFFVDGEVRSWDEASRCDTQAFGRWHRAMLDNGVMWPPAQFEAGFVSIAHDATALQLTARAANAAFAAV
ncbi:MAG: glutamate-1-semialdehyde 2,1-aminomutase [Myxococcota bacterium]|nr:glutamate-1-semialdehyde 2,1-aminomutase [Myxococcota bacterium]